MALFKINGSDVKKMVVKSVDLERQLQRLFEGNLEEILNITFLASEYSTSSGGRMDTLGIDKNGAPVIIEFKKSQNENIINQGLSYLRWLLDHKGNFEILCKNKNVDVDIDWDSPRVICIAESYNKFDIDTVDILPINIELYRYRIYDENILYLEPENYQKVRISTSGIIKKSNKEKTEVLQKDYSVDQHLEIASEDIKSLFLTLREKITALDEDVLEEAKAKYIAYKLSTNFADVVILHNSLKIFVNVKSGKLNDPDNIARDLEKPKHIGHWGNGDYEIKLEHQKDLEKVFNLIKQSFDFNK